MKRLLLLPFLALSSLVAQNVAINNTGAIGNSNAILDVDVSTNDKGVLIPRITTAQRTAMNPSLGVADEGLTVYDEILNSFWFWDGTQWVQLQNSSSGWQLAGNAATNPATNFVGTTDANDLAFRTNNTERMRIMSLGNIGIGTTAPATSAKVEITSTSQGLLIPRVALVAVTNNVTPISAPATSLLVYNTNGAVTGGSGAGFYFWDGTQWQRILSSTTTGSAWFTTGNAGTNAATNFIGTTDNIDFVTRTNNIERMRVNTAGNVGIGTTTPMATTRLQVSGGAITPQTGNNTSSGIYFTPDPGGGGGDEAYIRHYVEAGENTKLVIANLNDFDDDVSIRTGLSGGYERVQVNGNGTVYLNRGVFFDCNDCGGTANGSYDLADGTGGNYGDLSIQGRVLSANSNIHLSPPGGFRVIINSTYRAAGGGTGTTGLDIEDGGIRMRKNYAYIQRWFYTTSSSGVDNGATYGLGNWDICVVAQVGFKNNASSTDEDDDVQCAVYPNGAGPGEQTTYDYYYTEQFNSKRYWYMYMEAYEDTNGVTCAASCMNFE